MGLLNKLSKALMNTLSEAAIVTIERNKDSFSIVRRPSLPDDGIPGRVTAITYDIINASGRKVIHWNPDALLESISVLDAPDASVPIQGLSLRQAIFEGLARETRAAYADNSLSATMSNTTRPDGTSDVMFGYKLRR